MSGDVWLTETYFTWLASDAFSEASERKEYEGVLRVLHDIPFFWTIWSDENRAGDALGYRQSEFLNTQRDLDRLDQHWLDAWSHSTPSVLEVLLGIARRWNAYFEGPVPYYFGHMFVNFGFTQFPGRKLSSDTTRLVAAKCQNWMSHQIPNTGDGGPFPLKQGRFGIDMNRVDILMQMNAYSAEHFQ